MQADVSLPEEVERLFDEASRRFGPVTHLVNNAGVPGRIGRVEALDAAVLRRTFEVNVYASFFCAQAFVKRASTRHGGAGGAIVNVCSASPAVMPLSGMAVMYLLMSAFHLRPWLRMVGRRTVGRFGS